MGGAKAPFVLGIDLGTASVGWAMLPEGRPPAGDLRLGVRIFEAAYLIEKNKNVSAAAPRRTARLARRQVERRARRLNRLFHLLQEVGLLPAGDSAAPEQRDALIKQFDRETERARREAWPTVQRLGPLVLRARALDEVLTPFEIGRSLFHLAQRRGYQKLRGAPTGEDEAPAAVNEESNGNEANDPSEPSGKARRKPRKPKARKPGKVQASIDSLDAAMKVSGARTLGEHLSRLDPTQKTEDGAQRIRRRYISRAHVRAEFTAIWEAQARHHPVLLNKNIRPQVWQAIFFQRPLKWSRRTIGRCEFEGARGKLRAPMALLDCQEFRIRQRINDLRIVSKGDSRPLSPDERDKAFAHLDANGDTVLRTLAREALDLPKGARFNFEIDIAGETTSERVSTASKLPGNRTAAGIIKVLGAEAWGAMSRPMKDEAIDDVRTFMDSDALVKKWQRRWANMWGTGRPPWTAEQSATLAGLALESSRLNLSLTAVRKLLPLMREGVPYATAVKQIYPARSQAAKPVDRLPPVRKAFPEVRNPVVERALTELRKVVNAIVREHGIPASIRVELARDLKRSGDDRTAILQANRRREDARDRARKRVAEVLGCDEVAVTDGQVERSRLLDELPQPARCPYCGHATLSPLDVFGDEGEIQIEHIIPFSRSLDDSFLNKTLACAKCNAAKSKMTPREMLESDPDRWAGILERFDRLRIADWRQRWPGQDNPKRRKAGMTAEEIEEFRSKFDTRALNDTRYASRLARQYLALLYGGINDASNRQRIGVGSGEVTAHLRNAWEMNGILHDGPGKTRGDHRHHAVDALVIALTTPATLADLSAASEQAEARWDRRRAIRRAIKCDPPWPTLRADAADAVDRIVVSHRVNRRIAGQLHDATQYAADGTARRFKGKKPESLVAIGDGVRRRLIAPESNHHAVVFEFEEAGKGRGEKKGEWGIDVVTRIEAFRRCAEARVARKRDPSAPSVVRRKLPEGKRFRFWICPGDTIRLTEWDGSPLAIVKSISDGRVECMRIDDARKVAERNREDKDDRNRYLFASGKKLREAGAEKVVILPTGQVEVTRD